MIELYILSSTGINLFSYPNNENCDNLSAFLSGINDYYRNSYNSNIIRTELENGLVLKSNYIEMNKKKRVTLYEFDEEYFSKKDKSRLSDELKKGQEIIKRLNDKRKVKIYNVNINVNYELVYDKNTPNLLYFIVYPKEYEHLEMENGKNFNDLFLSELESLLDDNSEVIRKCSMLCETTNPELIAFNSKIQTLVENYELKTQELLNNSSFSMRVNVSKKNENVIQSISYLISRSYDIANKENISFSKYVQQIAEKNKIIYIPDKNFKRQMIQQKRVIQNKELKIEIIKTLNNLIKTIRAQKKKNLKI
jgi:hypothetical protein